MKKPGGETGRVGTIYARVWGLGEHAPVDDTLDAAPTERAALRRNVPKRNDRPQFKVQ